MADFIPALKDGIRSAYCFAFNNNQAIFGTFNRLNPSPIIGNISGAISKFVCNKPEPDQDLPGSSIEGGQCPGVSYQVQVVGTNNTTGAAFDFNQGNFTGPIRRNDAALPAPPDCGAQVLFRFRFEDGAGNLIIQGNSCGPIAGVINLVCTPNNPALEPPGGCGDGPPNLPAPTNITGDIDIDYGDSNEFNLTTPIIFAPVYVALDGTVNIPFTIEELNLVGELALNGDLEINLRPNGNNPPNTGNDDPIGDPDDEGGDPDDEAEDERGNIIGVFVVVTSVPTDRATFIPQSAGPNIIAPRAGSVKFKVSIDGRSGWTEDLPVKSSNAWIPVPGRVLASDVQVTPDFSSELSFRVVRERPEAA